MMKPNFRKGTLALLCGATIAIGGCGGGGDSDSNSSITAVPSLGQISNATVTIYRADGTTVLGSGEIGANGAVAIDFSGYSGPVVIEVAGDADAQYFDEASGTLVSFPAGKKIRAIAPSASGSFAVTALTELAYQGAVSQNLLPLDATEVNQLNEKVRVALIPEIADILTPPTLFNAGTTSGGLANNDAGEYALKLAALAKLGASSAAPALAVMEALAADLADGDVDGLDGGGNSVNAPYSNFATEFGTAISTMASGFGSAELISAASGYAAPATTIDFGSVNSGGNSSGSGSSASLSCNTSLYQPGAAVSTPTAQQLADFARTYTGKEGSYDNSFNFTPSGDATLVFGSDGSASYNGMAYTVTSACYEANQTYGGMLYLHFGNGDIDLFADGAWSGSSPKDGTIIQGSLPSDSGSNGSGGNGGATASGITLSKAIGGQSSLANSTATITPITNPTINSTTYKAEWGNALDSFKAVMQHSVVPNYLGASYESFTFNLARVGGGSTLSAQLSLSSGGVCMFSWSGTTMPSSYKLCSEMGITLDRSSGVVTFSNTSMTDMVGGNGTFTIDGSLGFSPY